MHKRRERENIKQTNNGIIIEINNDKLLFYDSNYYDFQHSCFQPEDEDEPFILEDTCVLNTENIDAHSCETSSLASSDSGDRTHLKRNGHFLNLATH